MHRTKQTVSPTSDQFSAYEGMFAYFNTKLFAGELPACLLNFSRKSKTRGFFAPKRWEKGQEVRHEISLNPSTLKAREPIEVASTLVHEMCHLWQQEHGKPSRTGYHNREWSEKMESVGLTPSDTGAEGGSKTGQKMTHYITPGGVFEKAFKDMPANYLLPWVCEERDEKKARAKNKIKYTCPGCSANVWGKRGIGIVCEDCEETFEADEE